MKDIKVAVIGLDTSHTIQFAMRAQASDCPEEQKIHGLRFVSCMRFETPFQDKKGLDGRQAQLEQWGIKVTEDFDEAVRDCDAIMLEINDPSLHLPYFKRTAGLGKPMFLDKPLADHAENGIRIVELAEQFGTRVFSSSSLRFVPEMSQAAAAVRDPNACSVAGPLGMAPAGESVVWYGVHSFEMLQRLMGQGVRSVRAIPDILGVTALVDYRDGRRGIVELTENAFVYGGTLRNHQVIHPFSIQMDRAYKSLLDEIVLFFKGGPAPVSLSDTLEVMGMLDAAVRSVKTGEKQVLATT